MNKKGFTLIELLATIVIIAIVAVISVPTIGNIITDFSNRVYIESEKVLERTGQNYFLTNDVLLPTELGESSFIRLDQLVEVAASEKIIDPKDQKECEGYLIVSKPTSNSYDYEAYIKCGTNYETPLYDLESAMEPAITLLGDNPVNILIGESYVEAGAKARDKYGNNLTTQITIDNPVNINSGGVYQVTYKVTDNDGVTKTVNRTVNVLDTINPVITLNSPNPYILWQDGIYAEPGYTVTDNDLTDTTISSRVTRSDDIAPGLPNNYTVTYTVFDKANNKGETTRTVTVMADPAPTVVFGTNGNSTWGTSRSTTVTVSDVGSGVDSSTLKYQWTTNITTPSEASFTTTFVNGGTITTPVGVSGTYYLWILAKDNNGHMTRTNSAVFNIDNTKPTITANNASSSWFASRTSTVTGTDNSSIGEIRYQWDSNGMNSACTSGGTVTTTGTALTVPGGSHSLYLCIRDTAGNTEVYSSGADMFRVDSTAPSIPTLTVNESWTNAASVSGTIGSSTDAESGINRYEYSMSGATTLSWTTGTSFNVTNAGSTTITVRSVNGAGATSSTTSKVVNIDRTAPTIANIIGGNLLYTDSNFASGNNGLIVYNNLGNGTVTHTRTAMTTPVGSYAIRIVTNGSATPGAGGLINNTTSAPSRVYYHKIIARIPVGYTINQANNAVGDGATFTWLTSRNGTGDWEEYIYVLRSGATGSFSTFGHVYLTGTSNTSVTWDVAYATIFDATDTTANTISFNSNDSNSSINGYGVNQSSTVAPTFTSVTATSKLSIQLAPMSTSGTYYIWTKDTAGNTVNSSFIIDTSTAYSYRDQFWCYAAVNSTTAPSCAGTSIGTQGTDYGAYGSSVLQWDSCSVGGSNYAYGGYAGADIAYTTWPVSGYWSQSRNTSLDLYADYQHVRCSLSVRYKQSAPWGTYNTAYAETRYTRTFTNRVLWWTTWSAWQSTAVSGTATREVQTSTTYKFRSS